MAYRLNEGRVNALVRRFPAFLEQLLTPQRKASACSPPPKRSCGGSTEDSRVFGRQRFAGTVNVKRQTHAGGIRRARVTIDNSMTRLTDEEELARLDALICDLDAPLGTPLGYMREHLTAARSYLLGSMPEEYRMILELAKETLTEIDQAQLRSRIDEFLRQATLT
jgi:hypothetical protein